MSRAFILSLGSHRNHNWCQRRKSLLMLRENFSVPLCLAIPGGKEQ